LKIKVKVAYDGTQFYGSQEQTDKKTVVGELHSVLKQLNIFEQIVMSGRTDRGVHATGQIFHLDIPQYWNIPNLLYALKRSLPKTISIQNISEVSQDFHARFSAKRRVYRYIFSTSSRNPFEEQFVTFIENGDFDFAKIKDNINLFQGEHNFQNFRKLGSDNLSDIREIFKIKAYQFGKYYILKFEANSFLRSQVRLMVGSLLSLGYGKISKFDIENLLFGEKKSLPKIAPPNGLYLAKIIY